MRKTIGYLTLNRELVDCGLFTAKEKSTTLHIFLWLLFSATHTKSKREVVFNDKQMLLNVNQLVTATDEVVRATGISHNTVDRALQWLAENHYIEMESSHHGRYGRLIQIIRPFGIDGKATTPELPQILGASLVNPSPTTGVRVDNALGSGLVSRLGTLENDKNSKPEKNDNTVKNPSDTVTDNEEISSGGVSNDYEAIQNPATIYEPFDRSHLNIDGCLESAKKVPLFVRGTDEIAGGRVIKLFVSLIQLLHGKTPVNYDSEKQGCVLYGRLNATKWVSKSNLPKHVLQDLIVNYVKAMKCDSVKELSGYVLAEYILKNVQSELARWGIGVPKPTQPVISSKVYAPKMYTDVAAPPAAPPPESPAPTAPLTEGAPASSRAGSNDTTAATDVLDPLSVTDAELDKMLRELQGEPTGSAYTPDSIKQQRQEREVRQLLGDDAS